MPEPLDDRDDLDLRRPVRRTFIAALVAMVATAATAVALVPRRGRSRGSAATLPTGVSIPAVTEPVAVPDGVDLDPSTPFITPNDEFFLIDTAWSVPDIDVATWRLDINGMVERPLTLSYDDLLARPMVERLITIGCVSNEVGGDYIGTARWTGVLLRDLLDEVGIADGAEQVFSTSEDGWTCGFPVEDALDGRDALVAVAMNGEPLPPAHGFPVRLVVPGLFGYVSATKWLRRITLTTWADQGYWIPRGWARDAPVKTQSRSGAPPAGATLEPGPVTSAGGAGAMQRGIDAVEVRVDGGDWQAAALGAEPTADAWRQWALDWTATAGEHVIEVRATDGFGDVQTDERRPVDPDGATGHHTVRIVVD
ncbi:MAG: molybdopterin-dependent oxidoreductase [Ilumatobacteraceae bacterium]